MNTLVLGLLIFLLTLVVGSFVYIIRFMQQSDKQALQFTQLVNNLVQGLDKRLEETRNILRDNEQVVTQRIDNMGGALTQVHEKMGQLREESRMIHEQTKSFQEVLKPPKLRGGIGEVLLETMIKQVLPREAYDFQYKFSNQYIVDAVIKLPDGLIPVDSKFPLELFENYSKSLEDKEREASRREFIRGIKKKIDDVSTKYIQTDENTLSFAYMYVPSENIYYHLITDPELVEYSNAKSVVISSPNTFYASLKTIAVGLKSFQIERGAKRLVSYLESLQNALALFSEDFRVAGSHLFNAHSKYKDSERKLESFGVKLSGCSDILKESRLSYENKRQSNSKSQKAESSKTV